MKAAHACAECRVYYRSISERSRSFYSGLSNAMVTTTIEEPRDFCGKAPGGALLAVEAPVCAAFQGER